jgi:excisionase family DNA binding protein
MEILATSVNRARDNLGISRATVYRLVNQGKLDLVKVGRRSLITMESQRALLAAA